jgi:hypothetical protein
MESDSYNLKFSKNEQSVDPLFKKNNVVYVDCNENNYSSNQIKFDISSLYNDKKYINAREAYLTIPVVAVMSHEKDNVIFSPNAYGFGFKSGYYNLVNSIQIQYDNQTMVQQVNNLNYYVNFKKLTKTGLDKYNKHKYDEGFIVDGKAWEYNDAPSASGNGLSNNRIVKDTSISNVLASEINEGFFNRMKKTGFTADGKMVDNADLLKDLKPYMVTTSKYIVIYDLAVIKLSDLSSFFENLPLTKKMNCSITLDLNMGSLMMKYDNNKKLSLTRGDIDVRKDTFPLMVSPAGDETGLKLPAVDEVVLGCYVHKVLPSKGTVRQDTLDVPNHPLEKCRIYIPMVEMDNQVEEDYIKYMLEKEVYYDDFNYQTLLNVQPGHNFNFSLPNSLNNLKGILIIPFLSSEVNGKIVTSGTNVTTHNPFSPCISPFTSEPSTTSPMAIIRDFNVMIGGENVYNRNINYGYENFVNELSKVNAVRGDADDRQSSGLIDYEMYSHNYRYMYVDLSRLMEFNTTKSIQLVGVNGCKKQMDYHIYLIFNKKIILNCINGAAQVV